MNLITVFITGLTTGGLTCLAMQGGLLTGVIANQKEEEVSGKNKNNKLDLMDWLPVGMFLTMKLISHVLLGFLLGLLGSAFTLSLGLKLFFQTLASLFMIATAMNLLEVHPIFRRIAFQPPRFMQRWIRNTSKSKALFAPAMLGMMTIFIPCGVTQAMEVNAIASGRPISGALIMAAFVLGTWPLFSLIGVLASRLSEMFQKWFLYAAAIVLIFMGISGIRGVYAVMGAPKNLDQLAEFIVRANTSAKIAQNEGATEKTGQVQEIKIQIVNSGYIPAKITVKKGILVRLTLQTQNTYSCASAFILRKFGIQVQLGPTDKKVFTFVPTETGKFPYTCAMGMYRGVLEVI